MLANALCPLCGHVLKQIVEGEDFVSPSDELSKYEWFRCAGGHMICATDEHRTTRINPKRGQQKQKDTNVHIAFGDSAEL